MHILFEYFSNIGIENSNDITKILRWKKTHLSNMIYQIEALDINAISESDSFFRFAGNEQFSAGRIPCSSLECRIKQANNLGIFSSLYSDVTYIYNPFEQYYYCTEWNIDIKRSLIDDLKIIFHLKPLINASLIAFSAGVLHMCKDCKEKLINEMFDNDLKLQNLIINNSKFIVENDTSGSYSLHIISNDDIFGHNNFYVKFPNGQLNKYIKRSNCNHTLTRTELLDSGLLRHTISERLIDISLHNRNAEFYNCNYINSSNFAKNIVATINGPKQNLINDDIYENYTHALPVVFNTNFDKLIKFRKNEFEAFLVYRDALRELITVKNDYSHLDDIFQDVVQPEINKMNLAIKNSRSIFKSKGVKDIAIGAGFISFGLFSGLLPPDSKELVSLLGGCEFIKGIIENLANSRSATEDIRNSRFYFVWKLKEMKV